MSTPQRPAIAELEAVRALIKTRASIPADVALDLVHLIELVLNWPTNTCDMVSRGQVQRWLDEQAQAVLPGIVHDLTGVAGERR